MTKRPKFGLLEDFAGSLSDANFIKQFGAKAWGISRLPKVWVPQTVLVEADVATFLRSASEKEKDVFLQELVDFLGKAGIAAPGIVRSSSTEETLLDRGRYLTEILEHLSQEHIAESFDRIAVDFERKKGRGRMAFVIQPQVAAKAKGHLANFRRVSPTRNQWQADIEGKDLRLVGQDGGIRRENFNSQRDEPPGSLIPLPSANDAIELKAQLKKLGAWLAQNLEPVVSVEWVATNDALWVVQCDDEVDPPEAVDPNKLDVPIAQSGENEEPPEPFDRYCIGSGSHLRKLSALDDFDVPSATQLPEIFVASASAVAQIIARNPDNLAMELSEFAPNGLVLRTDYLEAVGNEGMNLPRTDTVLGDEAVKWLEVQIQELQNASRSLEQWHFLLHRFIPARASAWSFAEPDGRFVRVDSLWGIPDGIQFFPHDTFEFDLVQDRIVRPIHSFKPLFTWPNPDGSWTNMRVQANKARGRSLSASEVGYISRYTAEVAQKIKEPAQIMWFCGFRKGGRYEHPLPWYREKYAQKHTALQAAPELPECIIRSAADAQNVAAGSLPNPHRLILIPNSEVIRDKEFIDAVAEAAASGNHSVVLDGSPLAHAFHQLTSRGVPLYSSRTPPRRRRIKKQDFGKLVRDRIPEIIEQNGDVATFGRVPKTERRKLLVAKAFEELVELAEAEEGSRVDELADLYEVLTSILREFDISWSEVKEIAVNKNERRGGFKDGIVLVGTNLPAPNPASLLAESSPTRSVIKPYEALREATRIETGDGFASIPIATLLSKEDGVDMTFKNKASRDFHISIRVEGDRIVLIQRIDSKDEKKRGRKPDISDGDLF